MQSLRETMRTSRKVQVVCGALVALGIAVSAGMALAAPPVPDAAAPAKHRPTVESAPNGTPVVQITNPSAGGVSRNQFTRFDVDPGGVILNNARTLAPTQLAGWIAPNPNLTKDASVILNEVTSADPSRLLGYLEVAGAKAEVVIANPNGITCDGCGFINASRGTLTTGTPVFGGTGSLDAFRVTGGAIAIEGAGLNAANVDRVALISRAVTANAGIWARELAVVAGTNEVDRSTLVATPIAGAGQAPAVSIDVGALGGMYARKILLVGTERGVGVTSAGTLAAEGEFRLDSDGQISLRGPTTAGGATSLRTGGALDARDTLYSAGSLRIEAAGAVTTGGFLGAQGDLSVQAERITLGGATGAGVTPEARVAALGALSLAASGTVEAGGRQLVSGGAISLDGAELSLSGATVQAFGGISLTGRSGDVALTGALVEAAGPLTLTAGRDILATDGTLTSASALNAVAAGLFDNTRGLVIGGQVQLRAAELRSQGAEAAIVSAGDMQLLTTRFLNADGALVYAGRDLLIAGASDGGGLVPAEVVLNRSAQLEAGRDLTIVTDVLRNEKSVFEVTYDVEPVLTETHDVVRAAALTDSEWRLFVPGNYDYSDGWSKKRLYTQTATYIPEITADSAPAELRAGGNLTLRAGSVVNDQSRIAAGGSILDEGVSYTQPPLPGNLVEERIWYWVDARRFDFCNGTFDVGCETSHHSDSRAFTSSHELRSSVVEIIPNTAERVAHTGDVPEAPGLSASAPAITLPANRLFTVHRDPGHPYLVETDPRFTKLGNFISSDYLLDRLPVNPEAPLKRLGDGFYEQRLVMDELFRATGTPYLPGSADAMAQYQALLDEGYVHAKELSLTPGIALSAEQLVRLTSPMVWMVTVRVDGEDVLAPKLYMPSGKHAAVTAGGSIVAGGGITWQLAGEHSLGGRAAAGKDLTVSAGTVRSQSGSFEAGRDARIAGKDGVQLDAATIAAGGNATVESASGSVRLGAGTHQHQKDAANVTGVVGTVIAAGKDVTVRAAQDVTLTAATLQAAKDVELSAGRDLSLTTAEQVTRTDGAVTREQVGTTAVAAGALRVTAGNDARLAGAQLGAAGDVHLEAGGDLTLAAVHDSLEAAGVGVSVGQGKGAAAGFQATGSIGTSEEDAHDRTYSETAIRSAGAVSLRSGRDTALRGAIVTGDSLAVDVGGDLTLRSDQDSSTYHSTDLSLSGQGTVGYGYSASLTASYAGMESKYRSVQEQTGLFAGQGGYTVKVGGNTHLQGAVIASEADASKNLLDTGSLTWSELENESKFSAVSISVTVGTGGGGVTPGVPIQGEKSSKTHAAVSPGTIVVRDGAADLSRLSQDTAQATNAIGNTFDRARIEEQKELVQVFGEEGFKAVGDLAQRYTKPYTDAELLERQAARYEELLAKGDGLTKQEREELKTYEEGGFRPDNVQQTLAHAQEQKQRYQEQYDRWKDGSPLKTALHAAVGALQAGLGGGSIVAGGIGAGTSERLSEVTANLPSSVRPYASAVIGAVAAKVTGANGLGAITGGATADYGFRYNRELHPSERELIAKLAREHWEEWGYADEKAALGYLSAAACALVKCGEGISEADPDGRASALQYQAWGDTLTEEKKVLQWHAAQAHEAAKTAYMAEYERQFAAFDRSGYVTYPELGGFPTLGFEYTDADKREDQLGRNAVATHIFGGLQAVGGVLEVGLGAGGVAACPETAGLTCAMGWGALALGTDNMVTGVRTAWTGVPYNTNFNGLLQSVGFSPEMAAGMELVANLSAAGGLAGKVQPFPYGLGIVRDPLPPVPGAGLVKDVEPILTDPLTSAGTAGSRASSAANAARLREFLRQAEKYGAGGVRTLEDGRFRFYGKVRPAETVGEMAGRRLVREWNPESGATRTWHETLDHAGNIRQVRPQTGGPKVHYRFDADGNYLGSW